MLGYIAKVLETIQHSPNTWETLKVGVYRLEDDKEELVGEYHRNYSALFNTFFPCSYDGKDYALYSPDYTVSRVMELPSCRDIGGEEPSSDGFCPVDFYVPRYIDREYIDVEGERHRYRVNEPKAEYLGPRTQKFYRRDEKTGDQISVEKPDYAIAPLLYYPFGFIAGCIWGDDSSWKIEFLDLSEIGSGVIKRDSRFGYIEMPDRMSLRQAINIGDFKYDLTDEINYITIALQKRFDLTSGKMLNEDPFA